MKTISFGGDLLSVDILYEIIDTVYNEAMMSLIHIFATNVKRVRQEKGISQEKLADLSGLHRTYISAVERERRNISIENIEQIAKALDVDAASLFAVKEGV